MQRPVIVEGPDGAGKSTLVERLSQDLDRPVFHTGGPPGGKTLFEEKVKRAEQMAKTHLLDRTPHISERVYAPVDSRQMFVPPVALRDQLMGMNPVVIYCRLLKKSDMFRAIDQSKKEHKPAAQMELVMQRYNDIVELYDDVMQELQKAGVTILRYSWQFDRYQDLLRKVQTCAG